MGWREWLSVASDAGQAAGGVATVFAAAYGFIQFRRWKEQKRSENRGAVAASVLAALEPFCDAVGEWIDAAVHAAHEARDCEQGHDADNVLAGGTKDEFSRARDRQEELARSVFAARAYLSEEELEPALEANVVFERSRSDYRHAQAGFYDDVKTPLRQICEELRDAIQAHNAEIERVRAAGREVFRRIAQHNEPLRRAAHG